MDPKFAIEDTIVFRYPGMNVIIKGLNLVKDSISRESQQHGMGLLLFSD